jgi:hypothetical protein
MKLILLPGKSKNNIEWIVKVENKLSPLFDDTKNIGYAHWENDGPVIDLELELKRLTEKVETNESHMIFAKSAGTVLTLKAIASGVLNPKACLFVGFPLLMVHNQKLPIKDWLAAVKCPVIILQHTGDPIGPYSEVANYFTNLNARNQEIVELIGDSHDYNEFELFYTKFATLCKSS